jgi:zinc transport system ATP-binding protein
VIKPVVFSCKNVTYSYHNHKVLENITFDVHAGDIVTIIGPNGAGKSTLGRIIIGSLKADSGVIYREKGFKIGYMPQKVHVNALVPMTSEGFLRLSCGNESNLDRVIYQCNLDKILSKQLTDISAGEWQRVLFARLLLQDPDLLILDEPTQALDIGGQEDFYMMVEKMRVVGKKAVIMISHDLHTVMSSSNHVICLNQHICCSGVPESIRHNQHYKDLFKRKDVVSNYVHHHTPGS